MPKEEKLWSGMTDEELKAEREGFNCIGIDEKFEYCGIAYRRGKAEMIQQKISAKHSTIKKEGF